MSNKINYFHLRNYKLRKFENSDHCFHKYVIPLWPKPFNGKYFPSSTNGLWQHHE